MANYGRGVVGYVLTLIGLVHGCFTLLISLVIIIVIVRHQQRQQLRREAHITLILSANIYTLILILMIALIIINVQSLTGDVYDTDFSSSACVFKGYFVASMFCAVYLAFVTQVST